MEKRVVHFMIAEYIIVCLYLPLGCVYCVCMSRNPMLQPWASNALRSLAVPKFQPKFPLKVDLELGTAGTLRALIAHPCINKKHMNENERTRTHVLMKKIK